MEPDVGKTGSAPHAPEDAISPGDPQAVAKRVLRMLKAIPWVGIGAIGTGLGVLLLVAYFKAIGFVPPDVPSIIGASVFVAMLAVVFSAMVVGGVVIPAWAYQEGQLPHPPGAGAQRIPFAHRLGLPALQVIGVGALISYLGVREWMRCGAYANWYLSIGVAFASVGTGIWVWLEFKRIAAPRPWLKRSGNAAWVALLGALPLGVLMLLLLPGQNIGWSHLIVVIFVWGVVVATSALLDRFPVWGSALIATLCFPLVAFSLPALFGDASLYVRQVAEIAGIRSARPVELRVPVTTCRLIQSALASAEPRQPVDCDHPEWGSAHAQVLSNLGARWLVEVPLREGALRLTIPADGVQHVYRTPSTQSACRNVLKS